MPTSSWAWDGTPDMPTRTWACHPSEANLRWIEPTLSNEPGATSPGPGAPRKDDRYEPTRNDPPRRRPGRAARPVDGPGDRGGARRDARDRPGARDRRGRADGPPCPARGRGRASRDP